MYSGPDAVFMLHSFLSRFIQKLQSIIVSIYFFFRYHHRLYKIAAAAVVDDMFQN